MNKRKIILLATALCMVAILAVGGTLAYFTDTDQADNVFTIGRVDIALQENFGNDVGAEETDKQLMPGKKNAIKKEVWIELQENSRDAYVWYEYWIPAALDSINGSTGKDNKLHVNAYGYTWDTYYESYEGPNGEKVPFEQTWDHDADVELNKMGQNLVGPQGFMGTTEYNGLTYNRYVVLYHGILSNAKEDNGSVAAGDNNDDSNDNFVTTIAMSQVYLDAMVDYDNENGYYTYYGEPIVMSDEGEDVVYLTNTDQIVIPVYAFAIQADTFDSVYEAYAAYYHQMDEIEAKN